MFSSIVEVGTVSAAARALISALKSIPGLNIGASVLNAVIAGSIVAALGEGTIYIFEQIYLGKKTFQDVDWVKKVLESKLSTEVLEKAKKLLGTADGELDAKKLAKMILDAIKGTKK